MRKITRLLISAIVVHTIVNTNELSAGNIDQLQDALASDPEFSHVESAISVLPIVQQNAAYLDLLPTVIESETVKGAVANSDLMITNRIKNVQAMVKAEIEARTAELESDVPQVRQRERWTPFLEVFKGRGDQESRSSAGDTFQGFKTKTAGYTVGTDYLVSDSLLFGVSVSKMDTGVKSYDKGMVTDIDATHSTIFASYFLESYHIDAHVGYGSSEVESSRSITYLNETAESDYDIETLSIGLGTGYNVEIGGGLSFEPFAGINYSKMFVESFEEEGSSMNLDIESNELESLRSTLGLALQQELKFGEKSKVVVDLS